MVNMARTTLDAVDRRILAVLQRHGDISHAQLAQQVSSSPASCWRRIHAMEESGVLGATVRLLDPAAVGRGLDVICQVRLASQQPAARAELEAFILSREEIMECYSMTGEWDYMLRIVVADVRDYEAFLMQDLLRQATVASSASHFALKRIKYTTALPV